MFEKIQKGSNEILGGLGDTDPWKKLEVENLVSDSPYRGSVMRFFASGFFHQSVSPQPQSIPIGPFRIFSKIRGDICISRLTTGVVDTGGKWKNLQSEKF
jgi:hypothetical protein